MSSKNDNTITVDARYNYRSIPGTFFNNDLYFDRMLQTWERHGRRLYGLTPIQHLIGGNHLDNLCWYQIHSEREVEERLRKELGINVSYGFYMNVVSSLQKMELLNSDGWPTYRMIGWGLDPEEANTILFDDIASTYAHKKCRAYLLEDIKHCQECNRRFGTSEKTKPHAHHIAYPPPGSEIPEDYLMLCAECHGLRHRGGVVILNEMKFSEHQRRHLKKQVKEYVSLLADKKKQFDIAMKSAEAEAWALMKNGAEAEAKLKRQNAEIKAGEAKLKRQNAEIKAGEAKLKRQKGMCERQQFRIRKETMELSKKKSLVDMEASEIVIHNDFRMVGIPSDRNPIIVRSDGHV